MADFVATLLNSLTIGLLLFVIAVGLNIVFGVLDIINFAHGALYMLGAYLGFSCMSLLEWPFWLSLAVAPLGVAVVAVILDRLVLRFIYDRHITDSLLVTFALLLVINESVQLIWGAGIYALPPPPLLQGTLTLLGGIHFPIYNLFVIGLGLVMLAALWALFNRTRLGHIMRAASQDRETAQVLGINTTLVITTVFAFGAWLAAVGGVVASPMRVIDPGMGNRIIIESFIVVVIGGLGSFSGTFIGAVILGLIEGFGARYIPQAAMVLPYIGMAVVLLLKPTGLMGRSESL